MKNLVRVQSMLSVEKEILEKELGLSIQQDELVQALHIDDDKDFLEISKIFIEKLSKGKIAVESLLDPTRATEMLKSEEYDIIISDYQMPKINGIELLQEIRREGIETPFIIMTGKGREEVAILALNIGADYYLKKGSDAKSQFTELIHIINKITHLKNIENALFDSETRFRELVEKTNDGLIIQNQNGIFTYVNSKFCEILGYNKNELLGKEAINFITENGKKTFLEEMKKHEQQCSEPYELSWRKKDNQIIYTLVSSESLKNKNNGFSGSFNIITDITQRKLDEQKIKSLNSILLAIRNVNQLITKENNQESLLQGVCDTLVNVRGFYNAWIVLFDENDITISSQECGEGKKIIRLIEKLKLRQLEGNCIDALELNNIVSIPAICDGCLNCLMSENNISRTIMIASLIHEEKNYGYLTISLSPEFVDDEAEISLFQELADDVAFALNKLDLQMLNIMTQEELNDEKERLQQYLEIAEVMFLVIDSNERISLINKKGCEILECDEENVLGMNWFDEFIPENRREEIRSIFYSLMQGEREPTEFNENHIITRGGKEKLIAWRNTFLKDKEGNTVATLSSGEDITIKKQIEQDLIESEELYRNLVEISPDAIILSNLKGRILFTNKQTAALYGTEDVEEFIGENMFKYVAYFDLKYALEHVKEVIETGISKNKEYSMNRKDGTFLPVEISSSLICDNQNKPTSILMILRNISERKKAEQEIKEREENYFSLFNQMSEAFAHHKIVYNEKNLPTDFVFLNVNSNFEKFSGLKKDDIIGKKMSEIFPEVITDSQNSLKKFGHVAQTGNSTNFEIFSSSQKKWYNLSAYSPRRDYFATIIEDITERKIRDEGKEERMREKSFILDVLAHDLRNYQTVANGFIDLVIDKNPSIDISNIKELERAKTSIVQANSLLENLSIMMQSELNSTINLRQINIYNAVRRIEQTLKELFPRRNIILDFSRVENQTEVLADNLIDQLLLNILSNAVKNSEGETVQIGLELEKTTDNRCLISITDKAKGINPEERNAIFERFNEIGRNSGGTGLGLFIVKTLVERYNGNIWVESRIDEDYTKGSVFKIELNLI